MLVVAYELMKTVFAYVSSETARDFSCIFSSSNLLAGEQKVGWRNKMVQ
jgi:hypothetical protein